MVSSPAFFGKSGYFSPGFIISLIVKAAALPKITKSNKEFAPSLLAPCTDAEADSPAENNPSIILSLPSLDYVID